MADLETPDAVVSMDAICGMAEAAASIDTIAMVKEVRSLKVSWSRLEREREQEEIMAMRRYDEEHSPQMRAELNQISPQLAEVSSSMTAVPGSLGCKVAEMSTQAPATVAASLAAWSDSSTARKPAGHICNAASSLWMHLNTLVCGLSR